MSYLLTAVSQMIPKTSSTKQLKLMNLANSVGGAPCEPLTGCHWALAGLWCHTRPHRGRSVSLPHSHTGFSAGPHSPRPPLLTGSQPEAIPCPLSGGPLHRAAAGFIRPGKPECLHNLRSDVPSLLRFPFIRGESQAHCRSRVTPGCDHQPVGLLGHLEVPTQRAGGELERSRWLLHQSEPEPDMATV